MAERVNFYPVYCGQENELIEQAKANGGMFECPTKGCTVVCRIQSVVLPKEKRRRVSTPQEPIVVFHGTCAVPPPKT